MSWIYTKYKDWQIKPDLCHPHYAKHRSNYVVFKHNTEIHSTQTQKTLFLDLGGMIGINDPATTISLEDNREFSCWNHQISLVIERLNKLEAFVYKDTKIVNFASWPNILCFISNLDRYRIISGLSLLVDKEAERFHREKMNNILTKANEEANKSAALRKINK